MTPGGTDDLLFIICHEMLDGGFCIDIRGVKFFITQVGSHLTPKTSMTMAFTFKHLRYSLPLNISSRDRHRIFAYLLR